MTDSVAQGHFCLIHQAGRHKYVPVGSVDSSMNRKPLDEPSKIALLTLNLIQNLKSESVLLEGC